MRKPAHLSAVVLAITSLATAIVYRGARTVGATDPQPPQISYTYSSIALPASTTAAKPIAIAVAPDHSVWVDEEFHVDLKSVSGAATPIPTAIHIPQISAGVFAAIPFATPSPPATATPIRTGMSELGEGVRVDSNGNVWFTEGGWGLYCYPGSSPCTPWPYPADPYNASRIVRYNPANGTFACYTPPLNSPEVQGLAVDSVHNMIWYAEGGFNGAANSIGGFRIDTTLLSDCFQPPGDNGEPVCTTPMLPDCYTRFRASTDSSWPAHIAVDGQGMLWFTEYNGNKVGRIDPTVASGNIVEIPLPLYTYNPTPYLVTHGPWDIVIDENGDLWLTEFANGTLARVKPSLMSSNDCLQLNAQGQNPCVQRVQLIDDPTGYTVHGIFAGTAGMLWFTFSKRRPEPGVPGVGVVLTRENNAVIMLPPIPEANDHTTGIVQDLTTGDVWFDIYFADKVGRIQGFSVSTDADSDGIPNTTDNCPTTFNPDQANNDRNFINLSAYGLPADATLVQSDTFGDACDSDDDNDSLKDADEVGLGPGGPSNAVCPSASGNTNPFSNDSDGDLALDGVECAMGTDPMNAASRPTASQCSSASGPGDTDGDGLTDYVEYCYYGSRPWQGNSDEDSCGDGREVASINEDQTVNASDLGFIASRFGATWGTPAYVPDFDVKKDYQINAGDLGFVSSKFGSCP